MTNSREPYFTDKLLVDEAVEGDWALSQQHDLNGDAWPWLVRLDPRGGLMRLPDPRDAPAHEQVGPLDARLTARIAGHCGAPTGSGRPCRNPINQCHWHPEATATQRATPSDRPKRETRP